MKLLGRFHVPPRLAIWGLISVLAVPLLLLPHMSPSSSSSSSSTTLSSAQGPSTQSASQGESEGSEKVLEPTFERMLSRDVIWQLPSTGIPKGTLFFAHGCRHKPVDFWPQSPSCPSCVGLPEEKRLARAALRRGYAVITISSARQCWHGAWPPSQSEDVGAVKTILASWRQREGLKKLPLYAMGVSSGGFFVSVLSHAVPIEALVIMISPGVKPALNRSLDTKAAFPPTLFVHMPKDEHTAVLVHASVKLLRSSGVEAAEIEVREKAVTGGFLSERIEGMDYTLASIISQSLWHSRCLNASGYLAMDVKRYHWLQGVKEKGIRVEGADPSIPLLESVEEEMRVAYAFHEISADFREEIMDWFEGTCTELTGVRPPHSVVHRRCISFRFS